MPKSSISNISVIAQIFLIFGTHTLHDIRYRLPPKQKSPLAVSLNSMLTNIHVFALFEKLAIKEMIWDSFGSGKLQKDHIFTLESV